MDYLLDDDTVISLIRGNRKVVARARQEAGHLRLSTLTTFDVEIWLTNSKTPTRYLPVFQQFMGRYAVRDVTDDIAHRAANFRQHIRPKNPTRYRVQLILAATAHELKLTLVTRDPTFYAAFPNLTVEDWS